MQSKSVNLNPVRFPSLTRTCSISMCSRHPFHLHLQETTSHPLAAGVVRPWGTVIAPITLFEGQWRTGGVQHVNTVMIQSL